MLTSHVVCAFYFSSCTLHTSFLLSKRLPHIQGQVSQGTDTQTHNDSLWKPAYLGETGICGRNLPSLGGNSRFQDCSQYHNIFQNEITAKIECQSARMSGFGINRIHQDRSMCYLRMVLFQLVHGSSI